jgi:energy-coupling factor transport system permease protein
MRNKIIFGRYMDTDSWVHGLDPRAKTLSMILFMAAVFMIDSYFGVTIVLGFSLIMMKSTHIPLFLYARAIKPLTFILLFIVIFHLVFSTSGGQFIDVGLFNFYAGGLERGLISASRMMLFVSFAAMLSFTTQPERLAQGLSRLLKPIRYIGLSPDKLALMINISLRFIPTLFEESERIWKAQVSRGLELRNKPLRQRVKLILALLVPITFGAFRRAIELADSMEARGYRLGARRTAYLSLVWSSRDTLFLSLFLVPLAAIALI